MQTPHSGSRPPVAQRILIVDDQPGNLQVLGSALSKLGYEIIPAADGIAALKRLSLRPPDLVLLDLLMPGLDGFEVCRRIREQPAFAEIPIIFLSAADEKNLIVRALESGGVDYITKPFNHAELVSRVQTHLSLKTTRDRLRQLAEDKEELLGVLAHDLKNHLSGMHMTAQLLCERLAPDDPRLSQMAANLATASGQTLSFLREFLANTATDHGLSINLETVDLNATLQQAIQAYTETARQKEQTIEFGPMEEPLRVQADPVALRQVIDNLLSNAVKFSPPGKTIRAFTSQSGLVGEVRVRDEGPGLTAQDRERLFGRYTRLSAQPTGGEPSTGLGLSIVQKLVQAMHGTVREENPPGGGACFVVQLPTTVDPA